MENVAILLKENGFPEEAVAAGYLHDAVEDTAATIEDIALEFGPKVASLVQGNTENKGDSWEERKKHTIDLVKSAPLALKALVAADKLDNLHSLIAGYQLQGDDIWSAFKRGREKQQWYYEAIAEAVLENVPDSQIPLMFVELRERTVSFFRG